MNGFFLNCWVIAVEQFRRKKRFSSSMLVTLPSPPSLQTLFTKLIQVALEYNPLSNITCHFEKLKKHIEIHVSIGGHH